MYTIAAFIFLSSWFVHFNIGFQCPLGGYNNIQPQFGPGCIYRCHCVNDEQCDYNTGMCSSGCAAGWMGPGCQYGDVAYTKTAWQSSNTGSEKVVDGDQSSCSEINQMGEKWWRVDLNAVYRITGLVIFSNTPDVLKGFGVRVGNISSNSSADFNSTCFSHSVNENVSEVTYVLCTSQLVGKHLMITIPDLQTKMKLCDVRIYGGRSVAYKRFANQSSLDWGGVASRAVDGGTSTVYGDNTCTHTTEEKSPWWKVDLEQVYYISRIEIVNRQYCCADRLAGFSIAFALNGSFASVYKHSNVTPEKLTEVTNMSSEKARFIQIELTDALSGVLTLCEVFIYGDCLDNLCGWSCESPCFCAHSIDKRNKIDGYCPGGCAENWNGSKCNLCYIDRDDKCSKICGKCRQGSLCNASDGTCVDECQTGWWNLSCRSACDYCKYNTSCTQLEGICSECSKGEWGLYCEHTCTNCSVATRCNISNGICLEGCHQGNFGTNCDKQCGQCGGNGSCDRNSGECNDGCLPGWMNNTCTNVCPSGWFGVNCDKECGHCANKSSCHHVNGTCKDGCSPGYTESTCDMECPSGTFGLHCSQSCHHCAYDSSCHHVNGTCLNGCASGYIGTMCDTECIKGHYGYNCSEECGSCYNHTDCEHTNGACRLGCEPDFTGYICKEVLKDEQKKNDSEEKMASIGGSVGGAVVIILIVMGLVMWRRRRLSSANQHHSGIPEMRKMSSHDTLNTYENVSIFSQDAMKDVRSPVSNLAHGAYENIQGKFATIDKARKTKQKLELAGNSEHEDISPSLDNDGYISSDQPSEKNHYHEYGVYCNVEERRIRVENIEDYVKKAIYLSTDCEQEYQGLVSGPQNDMNVALKLANQAKNRYKGIYAYDNTRVVLDPLPQEPNSDYINACFIHGYKRDKAYIAAQGPTTVIVSDFWRMIWQYDINKVVMLTGLFEERKQKCHQYWPSDGSMEFGTLLVEIVNEEIYTEYTVRYLKVTKKGLTSQKLVTQFHFTAWPDRDVPDSPGALVQFWKKVRNTGAPTTDYPILVHCSAGIGRTGTYIALDYLYDEGQATGSISVFDCINSLRRQRVGMVQTAEQYVYLHEVLVEALSISAKRVDDNDFPNYYQKMRETDQAHKQPRLWVEYESLQKDIGLLDKATSKTSKQPVYEKAYEFECGRLPENKMKNRYGNIIPSRRYRPFLLTYAPGRSDYINAVILPTLKNKNGLILTQMPLPDTVVDFWTLAFENEVDTLVMLNEEDMPGENIGTYWPKENQITQFGPFTVTKVSESRMGTHVQRMLYVSKEGRDSVQNVKQFACSVWKLGSTIPESCSQFLSFLEEVESWQRRSENRPVIVHCLNGAEKSGLFCVLWCVLERVKADREVAIRSVVKQISVRRQQIIPSFEQYQFCHDIILEYLTNFVTYSNM